VITNAMEPTPGTTSDQHLVGHLPSFDSVDRIAAQRQPTSWSWTSAAVTQLSRSIYWHCARPHDQV